MNDIRSVGVIGAGQMGVGIAHVFALKGFAVRVHDIDPDRYAAAFAAIEKNLKRQASKRMIEEIAIGETLSRISQAKAYADFSACDLVIESAIENMAIKKKILADLSGVLKPEAILATNTSSISIT
ncbi:MAG: 3-hydroxybutyryl-CoA dehydrogenase, partial [Parvularculaceae bacterium]|nr:3-hydroxybutyryl-CoA dehydrogenase [Parvularculaceae bacterium]